MRFVRRNLWIAFAVCASGTSGATGCRATPLAETPPPALSPAGVHPGGQKIRTELYFGLARKGGQEVSPDEWAAFLTDEVTPLFPRGFTVVEASGQWRSDTGTIVKEKSKILVLLHDDDATSAKNLEAIRNAYKLRFGQESVIRSNQVAYVDF